MGEGWEGIAPSSRGSEDNWVGTCKAHDVSIGQKEDRGGAAGQMGKSKGCDEEGGVVSRGACCGEFAVGFCVWVRRSTLCVANLLES